MTAPLICVSCGGPFTASRPHAQTCSDACRARLYRGRLKEQRERLGADAASAARTGDLALLERVAQRTAALLARRS